jgi:hypothetical protein
MKFPLSTAAHSKFDMRAVSVIDLEKIPLELKMQFGGM